jgi:hypothetical protein
MTSCWASGDDDYPDRIIKSFRDACRDPKFMKYYGEATEEQMLEIIREKYPRRLSEN